MNPCDYRGTDISYATLCERRGWLSVNEIYITSDSNFVKEGKFLSERQRAIGFRHITVGRNSLDNLEVKDNKLIVHEFKRGRRVLEADILQTAHYINCLEFSLGIECIGMIHLLSSRSKYKVILTDEIKEILQKVYNLIDTLKYSPIPKAKKIYLCFHGCSFKDFCWS
jgi:CRISPR-associated exonuclease Cas4